MLRKKTTLPNPSLSATACFLILLAHCFSPAFADPPKYQTIAHDVLELESRLGIQPNHKLLDDIIDDARARIQTKAFYSEHNAIKILETIDDILLNKNFLYDGTTGLLSKALEPHRLDRQTKQYVTRFDPNHSGTNLRDKSTLERIILPSVRHKRHVLAHINESFHFAECKTFSFLYLGIADALGLPMKMALAPCHIFVRWHLGPGHPPHLNWETTTGVALSDHFIKSSHGISDTSVRSGAYMKSLSPSESMASAYYMLSNFIDNADMKVIYLTKVVQLNPKHGRAFFNRGTILYKKGHLDKALADYDQATGLDPTHSQAWNNRGNAWYEMGELDKALADYDQAIKLNPAHTMAYNNRGNVWFQKGHLRRAFEDYARAIELNPEYSDAYNNRGNVWYEMGESGNALKDYDKAIELKPGHTQASVNRKKILKSQRRP